MENHPKTAVNQYRHFGVVYIIRILSVYTLIKVVSYYDLSVCSCERWVFQKKGLDGGWVGCALSIFFLDFWKKINFAKPLTTSPHFSV